jgi:hypothetical protein
VHSSFSESDGNVRNVKRQEHWYEVKHVGGGGFGQVVLQECRSGKKKGELRAVKEIALLKQRSNPMDTTEN